MLQALAAHLPIAPPQSLRLAITQLQHGSCIFQSQCPTVDSPHYPHSLQLTAAHARPLQRDLLWLEVSFYGDISIQFLRGHYQKVSTGSEGLDSGDRAVILLLLL